MTKVFIVDEDVGLLRSYGIELEYGGYDVEWLRTATAARGRLLSLPGNEVDLLVVIDVMLAAGVDQEGIFAKEVTAGSLTTGIRLLELLAAEGSPSLFPCRCVLFSHATNGPLVGSIEAASRRFGVPFWRKSNLDTAVLFKEAVDARVSALDRRGAGSSAEGEAP